MDELQVILDGIEAILDLFKSDWISPFIKALDLITFIVECIEVIVQHFEAIVDGVEEGEKAILDCSEEGKNAILDGYEAIVDGNEITVGNVDTISKWCISYMYHCIHNNRCSQVCLLFEY